MWSYLLLLIVCCGCSPSEDPFKRRQQHNQKGEYIYRKHDEHLFAIPLPVKQPLPTYTWEKTAKGQHPKISKEFFRCKGSQLNPCRVLERKGEIHRYFDCGGAEKHSLPLRDGKEFIYPILIDLTNYIQSKMNKRVVITSGHRCPEHNVYTDPASSDNLYSKHTIGAEVSFYVQGMEDKPHLISKAIQDFYKENASYKGVKDYEEFKPFEKIPAGLSVAPLYNKEICIKVYQKKEGRNFDNRHPYPYISLQVRFDRDLNEKVTYSWEKANRNYHRW